MVDIPGGKDSGGGYFLLVHLLLLLILAASFRVNYYYLDREAGEVALSEARAIFQRDKTFRLWLSQLGGIYTRTTPATPRNPDLAVTPDSNLRLSDGSFLTLINPAYMMRLVYEYDHGRDSPLVRMVSAKPLQQENLADHWEAAALVRAGNDEPEIYEMASISGAPYFRYLRPAFIREQCLDCHAEQGYRLGELRGGLSVSLPVKQLLARRDTMLAVMGFWLLSIYLLGVVLLVWARSFVGRRMAERDRALNELAESEEKFRTVADFAYAWEYWLTPEGTFRYITPSVEKITGYPAELFLEDPDFIKSIIQGDDPEILHGQHREEEQHAVLEIDFRIRTANGKILWLRHISRPVYGPDGFYEGRRASNYDITEEVLAKCQLQHTIGELQEALNKVRVLGGFLPICARCKKIRDDKGCWQQIEEYISEHSDAVFSHSICPECRKEIYPKAGSKEGV